MNSIVSLDMTGNSSLSINDFSILHSHMICLFANSPHNRSNKLTWHEGLIPQDEIWVKIGGDKGDGSFKVAFQVANLPCPNSTQHTVIFCVFEAPDTYPNVHTALAIYKEEVATLCTTESVEVQ